MFFFLGVEDVVGFGVHSTAATSTTFHDNLGVTGGPVPGKKETRQRKVGRRRRERVNGLHIDLLLFFLLPFPVVGHDGHPLSHRLLGLVFWLAGLNSGLGRRLCFLL